MILKKLKGPCFVSLFVLIGVVACTRDNIEFGTIPENSYTHLGYVDTVGVRISTVLTDSFVTGGATSFLLGKYKDPYLGVIKTTPFFQLDKPASLPDIPLDASYDSVVFIARLNKYYYGDTSRQQTLYVNELNQSIYTTYGSNIYNTSNFEIKPVPLGSKTLRIRPSAEDSIIIRLGDAKGTELFAKVKDKAAEVSGTDDFQNYFKGISLTTGINDTAAVYGLSGEADTSLVIRLYYHTTIPYPASHSIDFPLALNNYRFNQLLADRSGTGIVSGGSTSGLTEIPASQTNDLSFSQPGTGLNLKITFPSLKGILLTDDYVKLMKAELIVRPAYLSFDKSKFRLPAQLSLAYTDASNIQGNELPDSTGISAMYATPVIDDIYGENNYYRFNITSYVSQLLNISGSENYGLYLAQDFSASSPEVSRLVIGNATHTNYITTLQLTILVVNK